MAAVICCLPDLLPKNEDLKREIEQLGMEQIRKLTSEIEDGLNSIDMTNLHRTRNSRFGDLLIRHLWTTCGEKLASKDCFLNRLDQETENVLSDVLEGEDNMSEKLPGKDVVKFIIVGCLVIKLRLKSESPYRFGPNLNVMDTNNLEFRLGSTYKELAFGRIMKNVPSSLYSSKTRHVNEVGIKEARDQVIKDLDVDNDDKSRRVIVIEGPDGIGKTTLANATFKSLDLTRYQVSRLEIEHNVSEPDMKSLQQRILRDLFCKSIDLRSCVEGQARLSNSFREEACWPVFIFIDNAHFDLSNLLPAEEQWLPGNSRILITTTDRQLCRIPAYIDQYYYEMKPLEEKEANDLYQKVLGRDEPTSSRTSQIDILI
ncbi:hypothetical protein SUGI_0722270 [Cryptomeria japonica]|nr:hypothetical protein SUGI_0722270 [Cryptomeria japonica]